MSLKTQNSTDNVASFFHKAINEIAKFDVPGKLLDFGCGAGQLVQDLQQYGYDAYGTDIILTVDPTTVSNNLLQIQSNPYRLPFDDNYFDIVISTSVLEHAHNKEECFREIHRVLKPNGYTMNLFPGKWYLPSEPHIYVPFINWFWPYLPKWWLALWAILGRRNKFQIGKTWRETYEQNMQFCKNGIFYYGNQYYQNLATLVFGNFSWPMVFYINNADGYFSRIFRKLPFKSISGMLSKNFRMSFLVMQKLN